MRASFLSIAASNFRQEIAGVTRGNSKSSCFIHLPTSISWLRYGEYNGHVSGKMQHQDFQYQGQTIALGHLQQSSADFEWVSKDGVKHIYRVWLRYSNHCYSRELDPDEEQEQDAYVVETEPRLRVYCPVRYSLTPQLVGMMGNLFLKPTSRVSLTMEANWTTYQLYLPHEGGTQQRYCAFFRIRNSSVQPVDGSYHSLDMHVESAYVRSNMVKTERHCPFGQVAQMTKDNISYR